MTKKKTIETTKNPTPKSYTKPVSEKMLAKVSMEKLHRDLDNGDSIDTISRRYGTSRDTIFALMGHYGLRTKYAQNRVFLNPTSELVEKLRECIDKDMTIPETCVAIGMPRSLKDVSSLIKKLGLKTQEMRMREARPERDKKIESLLRAGKRPAEIMREFPGVTRGTIAGLRYRLRQNGASLPETKKTRVYLSSSKGSKNPTKKTVVDPVQSQKLRPNAPTAPKFIEINREFNNPIPFEEIDNGKCRYPIGSKPPYMFCGEPVDSRCLPYCTSCGSFCFEPQEIKKRTDRSIGLRGSSWSKFALRFG